MPYFRILLLAPLLFYSLPESALAADASLPAAIAAPGQTAVLTTHAVGTQIYECKAGADGKLAWTFHEPAATLMAQDKIVGHHSAGPSWELSDGSAVVGKVAGSAPGTSPNDITWLKLDVISHGGTGTLSDVTTVQRINTVGGVLTGECDRAGAPRSMPYSADYVFLRNG
jgi:Protein of unknown function (DUF3455)